MNKFWNWTYRDGKHILKIDAPIADNDSWLDNDITPKMFQKELVACEGEDVTVEVNSYGGDVFAAATIYTYLKNYRGTVNIEIILACSAASVIAMAGDIVAITPTGAIMIHDPMTAMFGNSAEMKQASKMLDSVKETIVNAYQLKTGLSRQRLSDLMTAETWLSPQAALDLKFVDKILFTDNQAGTLNSITFSAKKAQDKFLMKFQAAEKFLDGKALLDKYERKHRLKGWYD